MSNKEAPVQTDFEEINKDLYLNACMEILNETGDTELDLEHPELLAKKAKKFNLPQKQLWDFIANGNFDEIKETKINEYEKLCHKIFVEIAKEKGKVDFSDEKYIKEKIDNRVPYILFKKFVETRNFLETLE